MSSLRNLSWFSDQRLNLKKWINVNVFATRLTTRFVINWRHRNVEFIDDVLNEKHFKNLKTRNFFLFAATNQIIYEALSLWNLENDSNVESRSRSYNDWIIWKSKLKKFAKSDNVVENLKTFLRRIVEIIIAIAQTLKNNFWSM